MARQSRADEHEVGAKSKGLESFRAAFLQALRKGPFDVQEQRDRSGESAKLRYELDHYDRGRTYIISACRMLALLPTSQEAAADGGCFMEATALRDGNSVLHADSYAQRLARLLVPEFSGGSGMEH
jgi:hypothetical protein